MRSPERDVLAALKYPPFAIVCSLLLATCAALTSCIASRPAGVAHSALDAVKAVEQRRLSLTVAGDLAALRPILSDQLIYCHSSGLCESGSAMLGRLGTGELKYFKLDPREMQADRVSGTILLRGVVDAQVRNAGQNMTSRLRYLAVYENNTNGWQLRAYQSTPMP